MALARENRSPDKSVELSVDEIQKISASLGNLLWLAFSGGEIFLRDDLVAITKVFYEQNQPALILFPTNGLLPELIRDRITEVLQHCHKSTIVVKLSLDGPESLHNSMRGVGNSFQKTIKTYELLRPLLEEYPNFELGINTVFCSANQDVMPAVFDQVKGMDQVKTHTVSLVRGEVAENSLKEVDLEKYRAIINRMAADLKEKRAGRYRFLGARLKAAQDILQRRLIYETAAQQKRLIPCYAGRLNLVLTESGDLYPCESFTMKIGNVRQAGYDLNELLASGAAKKIAAFIKNNGCFCTHECYFMTNILFNPALYPALLKEYLQL